MKEENYSSIIFLVLGILIGISGTMLFINVNNPLPKKIQDSCLVVSAEVQYAEVVWPYRLYPVYSQMTHPYCLFTYREN